MRCIVEYLLDRDIVLMLDSMLIIETGLMPRSQFRY